MTRAMDSFRSARFDLVDARGNFQGKDLALVEAVQQYRTSASDERLLPVPAAYRSAPLSRDEAMRLAEPILRRRAEERGVGTDLPVTLYADTAMYFTFLLPVAEWQDEGRIPGGFLRSVDKIDADVWSEEDQEAYLELLAGA